MKKSILWILCIAIAAAVAGTAVACKDTGDTPPTGIIGVEEEREESTLTLSDKSLTMTVGDSYKLTVTYQTIDGRTLSFISDNPAVVTVSADGTVTAVSPGSATVTASYGELSEACVVTVELGGYVPSLGFENGKETYTLNVNDEYPLRPLVHLGQKTFADVAVTYQSSDDAVVSVEGNTLSALKTGSATVTASAEWRGMDADEYDTLRVAFDVYVKNSVLFLVNGQTVHDILLYTVASVPGSTESYANEAAFVPSVYVNGEEKMPDVTVGDETVVSYADGKLTAMRFGSTAITLSYTVDDVKIEEPAITVNVERPVFTITEPVQNFSAISGGWLDETEDYAVKTLGRLIPETPDTYIDAYQNGAEIAITEDGKIWGLTLDPAGPTSTSITIGTDSVLYAFEEVEAYGGILTNKEDLTVFNRTIGDKKPLVGYFELMNDIDMEGYDFKADNQITLNAYGMDLWGTVSSNTNYFQGTFEGNGYTISNFKSTGGITHSAGFFGAIYNDSIIRNVAFTGVTAAECGRVLATGLGNNVTIENVYIQIDGAVTGKPVGALGTQTGAGLTLNNIVIDIPVTAAYENEDYPRGTLLGGNGGDWKGASITNTYVYGAHFPIIVGFNAQGIGYAANDPENAWEKTLSGNASVVHFDGVKRYDGKGAMSAEAELDLSSFDNAYWGVRDGVPVWGSDERQYSVYVNGVPAYNTFEAEKDKQYTVAVRAFSPTACTLESNGTAVTVTENTFMYTGVGTATVTVKVNGQPIGSFLVQAARENVTVTEKADFSVFDGKIVSTDEAQWFGSEEYTIVSATLNGSPLTVENGKITGLVSSYRRQKGTLSNGLTIENVAPSDVNKLTGVLVVTTETHVVTFENVYVYDGVIITADQFINIFDLNEAGKIVDGFYVLGADIDMTGKTLSHSAIISDASPAQYNMTDTTGFHGIFDGRGHVISNFTAGIGGLFGKFCYGGMNSSWDDAGHGSKYYQTAVVRDVAVTNVNASAGPVLVRSVNGYNMSNISMNYLPVLENLYIGYSADCTALRGLIAHYRPAIRMNHVIVDASDVQETVVSGLPTGQNAQAPDTLLGNGTLFGSVGAIDVRFPNLGTNGTLVDLNTICYDNVYVIASESLKVGHGYGTDGTYLYECAGVAANRLPEDVTLASATEYTAANIASDVKEHKYYIFTTIYQYASMTELVADTNHFAAEEWNAYWTISDDGIAWTELI